MKISFITTVFNEENTILKLLDSLQNQTLKPSEVIIVDGGSEDRTLQLIGGYTKKLPIKVFIKKGNRSVGRNLAIKNSLHDVVAVSDAGCILDKNWLKRITDPLKNNKKIEVVAGFYKPITNSSFEKCLATYTCVPYEKVSKDFLPSSRSVAFRKSAWEKVGGYPEQLKTCEDLVFARQLKRKGFKFSVAKDAFVLWPQRKNLKEAAVQFYDYAKGDGRAFYIRKQTPILFGRYLLGIALLIFAFIYSIDSIFYLLILLLFLYVLWSIFKNYKYVNEVSAIIYLPLLQILSDIMVITGFIAGSLTRIWGTKK